MIDTKYIELIHREIDGLNSAHESAELQRFISSSHEAKDLYDELVAVSHMLHEIRSVDPSPNVKKIILNSIDTSRYTAINKQSVSHLISLTITNLQEGFMKGKIVIGGILVAVIAVVYFSFLYPWPGNSDVLGTIGGVKKYNSQQISDKDVQLNEHALVDGSQADPEVVLAFWNSQPLSMRESFAKDANQSLTKDANQYLTKDANQSLTKDANQSLTKDANQSLTKDANQSLTKDANQSLTKDANQSLTKDANQYLTKDANQSLTKDAYQSLSKSAPSGIQKSVASELAVAIQYWNTASIAQKQEFYKTWTFEKTQSLERSVNSDLQKSADKDLNKSADKDLNKSTDKDLNKSTDKDLNKTTEVGS